MYMIFQIIQNELSSRADDLIIMISTHGVASMWLHAWGQTTEPGGNVCDVSDDNDDLVSTCFNCPLITGIWFTQKEVLMFP